MFLPYEIVGKDYVNVNNVCGNVVTVLHNCLEGDHHGVSEISVVCVVFYFLRENIARIDDSRDVINIHIFQLMSLANHIFSEV